jgi:hypothetical protein
MPMSFAEIILRIGVAVGGWLIFIGNMLVIGVLRYADCEPGNDEMWRGTLFFGLLSGAAVAASGLGLRWRKDLRVVAVLAVLLFLYALPVIAAGLHETTLGGKTLCSVAGQTPQSVGLAESAPTLVEKIWAPAQLIVGLIAMAQAWRFLRSGPESEREAGEPH